LRTAFGEARMEPLDVYVDLATSVGLDVDVTEDLTQLTLPTFDRWRDNAVEHTDFVREAVGGDGVDAFVASIDILESLWRDGTMGYGLLGAALPVPLTEF
jgi:27-O-demethylrifamycin SV methyltransferase